MINDWLFDNESKVFSIVKMNSASSILNKFPKAVFTTSSTANGTANFPTIYIHEIEGYETGRTTELGTIESYTSTFEVRVTVDSKREDAKYIMRFILNEFKKLGFANTMTPIITSNANMFVATARFRRTICIDDIL